MIAQNRTASDHRHDPRVISYCDHSLEHSWIGYAIECACGWRGHRITQVVHPWPPAFPWMFAEISEDERVEAIRAERQACVLMREERKGHDT